MGVFSLLKLLKMRILFVWRNLRLTKIESMEKRPDRLSTVFDNLMGSLGLKRAYYGWQIVERWPEIVGQDIAQVARAEKFGDGTLVVVVEKDTWRQELEMQRETILAKIRRLPGGNAVKKIVLRAGSLRETTDGN